MPQTHRISFFIALAFTAVAPLTYLSFQYSLRQMLNFLSALKSHPLFCALTDHFARKRSSDTLISLLYHRSGVLCDPVPRVLPLISLAAQSHFRLGWRWIACYLAYLYCDCDSHAYEWDVGAEVGNGKVSLKVVGSLLCLVSMLMRSTIRATRCDVFYYS